MDRGICGDFGVVWVYNHVSKNEIRVMPQSRILHIINEHQEHHWVKKSWESVNFLLNVFIYQGF